MSDDWNYYYRKCAEREMNRAHNWPDDVKGADYGDAPRLTEFVRISIVSVLIVVLIMVGVALLSLRALAQGDFNAQVDAGSAAVTNTIGAWGPALKNLNAQVGQLKQENTALTAERDRMKAEIERRAAEKPAAEAPKP